MQGDTNDERWLSANEYFALALSTRRLWRNDRPKDGVVGLIDPESGEQFWIREDSLHHPLDGGRLKNGTPNNASLALDG